MNPSEAIAAIATENWKLQSVLGRALTALPEEKSARVEAQLRYSRDQLERILQDAGLRLVTFEGEEFTAELPVTPVNAEDFAGSKVAYVERTLEPTIVASGSVVRVGKVLLKGE